MESKTTRAGLILLIMFDEQQIPAFKERLHEIGYLDIEVCTCGDEALGKLKKTEISLVISDVELKGKLDGIETGKRIRDQYDLPLIYMSRLQDENTFQKALDTRPLAFLNKPVNWNELRMAIESALFRNKEKISMNAVRDEYRQRFEKSPVPYLILDTHGRLSDVNNAWTELTGYSADEVIGIRFGDFLASEEKDGFEENFSVFRKKGKTSDMNYKIIKKGGGEIYFTIDGRVRYDEEGNYIQSHCILKDITAQKLAEDALLESEKKFRNLVESAGDIIYLLDNDLKYLYGNNLCLERYGLTKEEFIGKNYRDFHSSERLDEFNKKIRAVQKSKKPIRYEHQSTTDGRYFLRTLSPIIDSETKEIVSITVISRDITEFKQVEEKLIESEERYRQLVELSPDAIMIHKDGKFVFVNRATLELFGAKAPDELIGQPIMERVHPDYRKIVNTRIKTIVGNEPYVPLIEEKFIKLDGTVFDVEVSANQISYHNTVAVQVIARDTTRRKKTEEALRESEQKLKEAQSIGRIGSWEFDVDHGTIEWSDETYKLYERDPALGPPTPDEEASYYTSEQAAILREYARRAIETGEQFEYDLQARLPGGRTAFFSASMHPVRDESGRVVRLFGTVQDITERKQAEEALRKSKELFEKTFNSQRDAILILDAKTPPTVIDCNTAAMEIFGFNSQEIIGRTTAFLHVDETALRNFQEHLYAAIAEQGFLHIPEFEMKRKDGTIFSTEHSVIPLEDEKGNRIGWVSVVRDITIRILAEKALLTSQSQLSNAMEIARLGYWEYDVAEDMFYFDDHFYNIFRTSAEKVGGYAMSSARYTELFVHPEDMDVVSTETRKAIETADPNYSRQLEHRIIYANGETGYIAVRFYIVKDEQGRTIKTFGANQDITHRKKVEKALEESEAMLRSILRTVSVGIGVVKNRVFELTNETYQKITGFSENELKGKSTRMVYPDDEEFKRAERMYSLMKKHGVGSVEVKHKHKNGKIIDVLINIAPIIPGDLNSGVAFTLFDITERKKAEEELLTSETKFRALFAHMSSGVTIYEYVPEKDEFIIRDMNKAGLTITQITDKERVIGKNILNVFPGAKSMGLTDVMRKVLKSGKSGKLSASYYKDDRIELYVDNYVYKLPTGEIVSVFDDITEKIVAEQVVLRNYEEIKKLVRHLETIREEERKHIAGELHDELGQVLTAIKMDVSWIRNKMPPERKGIKKRAGSTIQIIDEAIHTVQRLSMELRPRMLDDLGLLETLKAFFKEYKSWANIPVRYDLPENEPDLIPGQEITVFRIIQESLTNIARHAGATEVKLIIKVSNDNLDLNIQDNGIGIPVEKVHSSESFGILNMRERIQRWGGDIEIKGMTGKGTSITIRIPLRSIKK